MFCPLLLLGLQEFLQDGVAARGEVALASSQLTHVMVEVGEVHVGRFDHFDLRQVGVEGWHRHCGLLHPVTFGGLEGVAHASLVGEGGHTLFGRRVYVAVNFF